jgi:hypothetical protein
MDLGRYWIVCNAYLQASVAFMSAQVQLID